MVVPVAAGTAGTAATSDAFGNFGCMRELPLTYAMKLLLGFDVYKMLTEDVISELVARIVLAADLTEPFSGKF